jgi:hypothetical protein
MSSPLIDRVVATAYRIAEQQVGAGAFVDPILVLAGPRGEAVLRLDAGSDGSREPALAKGDLIATALVAEACAWTFLATLATPGSPEVPVVVVAGEHLAGGTMLIATFGGGAERLTLVPTPLALRGAADIPMPLRRFLRSPSPSAQATADAWRQLEAMGVTLGETRRAVH